MTKEEAIARIKNHKIVHEMNEPRAIYISEALDMVIEALEQTPCEECESGSPCIYCKHVFEEKGTEPKTGHWIFKNEDDQTCLIYTCDKCGEQISIFDDTIKSPQEGHYNYCPNCGTRMESEE